MRQRATSEKPVFMDEDGKKNKNKKKEKI